MREAKGEQAAQLIDHLKKAEMAKEAERLLDGTGWLPEPLRLADSEDVSNTPTDTVEELPAFLADCEGQDAATDESEPHSHRCRIAATRGAASAARVLAANRWRSPAAVPGFFR